MDAVVDPGAVARGPERHPRDGRGVGSRETSRTGVSVPRPRRRRVGHLRSPAETRPRSRP